MSVDAQASRPSPPRARLPGVLFVDDDPQVRRAFARIMERAHIPIETAESADEGLRLLEETPERFGVIATDYFMPGKTGVDLLQAAALCSPWSARILVSGQLAVEPLVNAINQCGVSQVVTKPWRARELERAVRRALDRANLALRNASLLDELKAQIRALRAQASSEDGDELARLRPFFERLAFMTERGSPPEQRHSARLATFARILAEARGLRPNEVLVCEMGALVHDVGKLLPDGMDAEALESGTVSLQTHHPESGYQLLAALPGMGEVATIVRQHHERFDGLGHPNGLAGPEIAIGARIFRLVSAFERLLRARPQVDEQEVEGVVREVAYDRGTQFDPSLVETLASVPGATWVAAYRGVGSSLSAPES